jgi:glycosyltransferase involved in cell wall biosynthesis
MNRMPNPSRSRGLTTAPAIPDAKPGGGVGRRGRPLRLVHIAPYPILPAVAGGKIRIAQLARAMCRLGAEVTVVAPYHVTQRRALAAREPFTLRQVPYAPFVIPFLLVDRPFPYGMLVSYHPGYRHLLPVAPGEFDICLIHHPAFVDVARAVPDRVPVIYESQNVEFDYVSAESPPGLVRTLAAGRVRELEARLVARAAHVHACTEADRRRFGELYGVPLDRVSVIPNGIDLAAVDAARAHARAGHRPAPPRLRRRAVYAGSNVAHNRGAVRAIVGRIAPMLASEVEFVLVGPCARGVRDAGPNVRLDPGGDVAAYADPGTIGLLPVVGGSGSNLKLLQYLACGLSVLSTPFGTRGFEDLLPWVVTAELEGFADALRQGLPAPEGVRERLAAYEWRAAGEQALALYETLVRA